MDKTEIKTERSSLRPLGIGGLVYSLLCAGGYNAYMLFVVAYTISMMKPGSTTGFDEFVFGLLTITFWAGFLISLFGSIVLIVNKIWGRKVFVLGVGIAIIHPFLSLILLPICTSDFPCSLEGFLQYISNLIAIVLIVVVPGIIIAKKLRKEV